MLPHAGELELGGLGDLFVFEYQNDLASRVNIDGMLVTFGLGYNF